MRDHWDTSVNYDPELDKEFNRLLNRIMEINRINEEYPLFTSLHADEKEQLLKELRQVQIKRGVLKDD